MNIVYLFLTYKNPELLLHTIQRLKAPHVEFTYTWTLHPERTFHAYKE